jgi:hypothetical protein
MVSMNDSTRRLIMMLTIILAGTAVTFLELSPVLVFLISLVIGVVMLFGLNILSFEELKEDLLAFRERLDQPVSLKKTKADKTSGDLKEPSKEKKADKTKEKEEGKKRELPFSGLIEKIQSRLPVKKEKKENPKGTAGKSSFISGIFAKINSKGKKEDKTKKIDELLDKAINEPVAEGIAGGASAGAAAAEVGEEDFSDFDSLDLGLEDEDPDFEFGDREDIPKPGKEAASPASVSGMDEDIPDSAIAEILAKEGIEFDLESDDEFPEMTGDEETPEQNKEGGKGLGDLDELDSDVSGLDLGDEEMDEFDQIDLDEIDTDEEPDFDEEDEDNIEIGDSEEEIQDFVVAPPDESDDLFAAPPKEWSQTKAGAGSEEISADEPLSLSFGGGGGGLDEDDLFAMLKADTKKAVVVQEQSLVRDLKDVNVESGELVEGLETILYNLGVKVEKIDGEEDSKPEHINNDNSGV